MIETHLDVEDIPIADVHYDEEFNCRGYIPPSSVMDLANDIKTNGLQQPITVQLYSDEMQLKTKKKCRVVAGHRRFTAISQVLKWTFIPAIVKTGLSEVQALILNLGENLQRTPLNILQEARALKRLKDAGLNQLDVAKALRMERPWVQTRYYVLDFPEDIQGEIGDGMLTQAQIHELHALEPELWYEAVRKIKDAKILAGTKRLKVSLKEFKKPDPSSLIKAKPRKSDEIEIMLDHVMESLGESLASRMLAWATGNCTTMDALLALKEECDILNAPYHIPKEGIPGL